MDFVSAPLPDVRLCPPVQYTQLRISKDQDCCLLPTPGNRYGYMESDQVVLTQLIPEIRFSPQKPGLSAREGFLDVFTVSRRKALQAQGFTVEAQYILNYTSPSPQERLQLAVLETCAHPAARILAHWRSQDSDLIPTYWDEFFHLNFGQEALAPCPFSPATTNWQQQLHLCLSLSDFKFDLWIYPGYAVWLFLEHPPPEFAWIIPLMNSLSGDGSCLYSPRCLEVAQILYHRIPQLQLQIQIQGSATFLPW